jgi:sulfiredoxin
MMKRETFAVADIYVPVNRHQYARYRPADTNPGAADGARFVLVEGLHRLEAAKALGETTIIGFRVEARKH